MLFSFTNWAVQKADESKITTLMNETTTHNSSGCLFVLIVIHKNIRSTLLKISKSKEACRGILLVIEFDDTKFVKWIWRLFTQQSTHCQIICSTTNLLVFGDRVQKLGVQFGVVLGQGLVAVVIDELHYSQEGKRFREAVPPVSVVNLYKLVVPPFPAGGDKWGGKKIRGRMAVHVDCLLTFIKGLVCFHWMS